MRRAKLLGPFALCTVANAAALAASARLPSLLQGQVALVSSSCDTCGTNNAGVANCCSNGGSWAGKCADALGDGAEHTWKDGYSACNSGTQEAAAPQVAPEQNATMKNASVSECKDTDDSCAAWAATGECGKNPGYMLDSCCRACAQSDFAAFKQAGRENPPVPQPSSSQANGGAQASAQQATTQQLKTQPEAAQQDNSEVHQGMTLGGLGISSQATQEQQAAPQAAEQQQYPAKAQQTAQQQQQTAQQQTAQAVPSVKHDMSAVNTATPAKKGDETPHAGKIILKDKNNRFNGRFEDLKGDLKHACSEVPEEEDCKRAVYWDYSLKEVLHECGWMDPAGGGNYACHDGKKVSTSSPASVTKQIKPTSSCSYCGGG
jgi:hypothetical protein